MKPIKVVDTYKIKAEVGSVSVKTRGYGEVVYHPLEQSGGYVPVMLISLKSVDFETGEIKYKARNLSNGNYVYPIEGNILSEDTFMKKMQKLKKDAEERYGE